MSKKISYEVKQEINSLTKLAEFYTESGDLDKVREIDELIYSLAQEADPSSSLLMEFNQTLSSMVGPLQQLSQKALQLGQSELDEYQRAAINKVYNNVGELVDAIKQAHLGGGLEETWNQ